MANRHITEQEAWDKTYIVKAHTGNLGRLYIPKALIGKRVRLEEVRIIPISWQCPQCLTTHKMGDRDKHIQKAHPGWISE
jgi:hypothetical protein